MIPPMKIEIKRIAFKDGYTIGRLYLNGEYFCDTLEDKVRNLPKSCPGTSSGGSCSCLEKVYSQTAIPAGSYKVIVNYSPKFKRRLPRLLDVPHFQGILIHRGNTAKDSAGCILVGENKVVGRLINSTPYEQRLVDILKKETNITIKII